MKLYFSTLSLKDNPCLTLISPLFSSPTPSLIWNTEYLPRLFRRIISLEALVAHLFCSCCHVGLSKCCLQSLLAFCPSPSHPSLLNMEKLIDGGGHPANRSLLASLCETHVKLIDCKWPGDSFSHKIEKTGTYLYVENMRKR